MLKKKFEVNLPELDDTLFSTEEERQAKGQESIQDIPLDEIRSFHNHPYGIRMDSPDMHDLINSINTFGCNFEAIVVRPHPDGKGYEMITGHRRLKALEVNGIPTIKAIIRDLSDDDATIYMVDSNIKREDVMPSEKGFAYKMKIDAMNHQGKRTNKASSQVGTKQRSDEKLAEQVGESRNQIQRFIRLTNLIKPLRDIVDGISEDGKHIGLNPAVELSYLNEQQQEYVLKYIQELDITPSHAQTIKIKELSKDNRLDENVIYSIMTEQKANQKEKLTFKLEDVDKYFPSSYTPHQKQELIIKLLEQHAKKREEKQQSR